MGNCYAHSLGNCKGGISREHIVSKAILDDVIVVIGLPGCKEKSMQIPKDRLVTKILCQHHNNQLSIYDETIAEHKKHIDLIDKNDSLFNRMPKMVKKNYFVCTLNGNDLERWFLKTLINICKTDKGLKIDSEILLPYLFDSIPFEYPYGLGNLTKPGLSLNSSNIIQMCPLLMDKDDETIVQGGIFRYRGFGYLLLLPPYEFSIEREKPIIDSIFTGKFQDLLGCQYNWHNEEIFYTAKKQSGLVVNAQSIKFKWE